MRTTLRLALALSVLAALAPVPSHAQYDDEGYDAPPPRRVYRRDEGYARPVRREAGFNCDAIQPGVFGPKPFSCPLPGPRPLGARCFCQTPVVPLSGGDTVAGRVVP